MDGKYIYGGPGQRIHNPDVLNILARLAGSDTPERDELLVSVLRAVEYLVQEVYRLPVKYGTRPRSVSAYLVWVVGGEVV